MNTVETIDVMRQQPESLFSASFWQECDREAAQILRAITGADEAG